jgi:Rifampin ADP-ribosyl transferase
MNQLPARKLSDARFGLVASGVRCFGLSSAGPALNMGMNEYPSRIARECSLERIAFTFFGVLAMTAKPTTFAQSFFHGTKADLKPGDRLAAGNASNYGSNENAAHIYLTATLDAAIWGAELATGAGPGRIYVVEPTGPVENDPDLTDKRFPGNPSMSYRSTDALLVLGEVIRWQGHSVEQLTAMKDGIASLAEAPEPSKG